jgi:hypothetical protein
MKFFSDIGQIFGKVGVKSEIYWKKLHDSKNEIFIWEVKSEAKKCLFWSVHVFKKEKEFQIKKNSLKLKREYSAFLSPFFIIVCCAEAATLRKQYFFWFSSLLFAWTIFNGSNLLPTMGCLADPTYCMQ